MRYSCHPMKRIWIVVLCALLFAVTGLAEDKPQTLALGSKAPDFKLQGVDDKWHTLKEYSQAKVLVVVFTCNHCPTAQAYEERIKSITSDYKRKGVTLIAISSNDPKALRLNELGYTDLSDSLEEMKIRAKDKKFEFPYLYDGDKQEAARAYGPVSTPHVFVFDAERTLRYVGRIDDSEREEFVKSRDLRNALDALLAGKEVPVKQTKAIGCSLKWAGKKDEVKAYMDQLAQEPVTIEEADGEKLKGLWKNDSGKFRLINVWSTECPPCVIEFPDLVKINRMYRHRDFEFITISANYPDEQKDVLAFLKKHQASNRNLVLSDPDRNKAFDTFDPVWDGALPYTILISPKSEVLYKVTGEVDMLELKRAIVSALGRQKLPSSK